jgi:hypothetical protein
LVHFFVDLDAHLVAYEDKGYSSIPSLISL